MSNSGHTSILACTAPQSSQTAGAAPPCLHSNPRVVRSKARTCSGRRSGVCPLGMGV